MARNGSGTYSLPSPENPVVTGTTISATSHNTTQTDIATELTDSLSRSAKGAMLGQLKAHVGTVAAPGVTFDGDLDCGLYRIGANDVGMSVNGVKTEGWTTTGAVLPLGVTVTQSQANTDAIVSTGTGSGDGIQATGGTTGAGGRFSAAGAAAVIATTTAGSVDAMTATSFGGDGANITAGGNGVGVRATGAGQGYGGEIVANGAACLNLIQNGLTFGHIRFTTLSPAPTTPAFGELYVDTSARAYICTNATGPVWSEIPSTARQLYAIYTSDAAQSIGNGSVVIVNFEDKEVDSPGTDNVTIGASWKFTVPAGQGGVYRVSAHVHYADLAVGITAALRLYKNGASSALLDYQVTGSAGSVHLNGDRLISLAATDYIDIRTEHSAGGAEALSASGLDNFVSIHRIAD